MSDIVFSSSVIEICCVLLFGRSDDVFNGVAIELVLFCGCVIEKVVGVVGFWVIRCINGVEDIVGFDECVSVF